MASGGPTGGTLSVDFELIDPEGELIGTERSVDSLSPFAIFALGGGFVNLVGEMLRLAESSVFLVPMKADVARWSMLLTEGERDLPDRGEVASVGDEIGSRLGSRGGV